MQRTLLFCFLVLGLSCNKTKEELGTLPDQTQTGANTLGFKVNGTVWTTSGKYCYNQYGNCRDNPMVRYNSFFNGQLDLTSDKVIYKGLTVQSSESFEFHIRKNFNRAGIYKLKGADSLYEATFRSNKTWSYYELLPDRETFEINVTNRDTISKVVSGVFSGTLFKSDNTMDSVIISEGRFDIKMQ